MKIFGKDITSLLPKKGVKINKKSYSGVTGSFDDIMSYAKDEVVVNTNQLYELYKGNGDIRQGVKKIAQYVNRDGFKIFEGTEEAEDLDLVENLSQLFSTPTQLTFRNTLFKHLVVAGEVYIIPVYNPAQELISFDVLDPRTMGKRYDKHGEILGFNQFVQGSKPISYTKDEIGFYILEEDIKNANNGMGLLESIVWYALSDMEAGKRNYYLHKNGAEPGTIWLLNEGVGENEVKILKQQIKEEYQKSKNAHKPLIGGGVRDVKSVSLTNKDMEFIQQNKLTTDKVSSVLGVPKSVLGYTEGVNYTNSKEQKKEFIDGTIQPYQDFYQYIVNDLLFKFTTDFDEGTRRVKCTTGVEEDKDAKVSRNTNRIKSGQATIDEIRVEDGLEPYGVAESQTPLITRDVVLLKDVSLDPVISLSE